LLYCFLDTRCSTTPAAEKKRKQCLKIELKKILECNNKSRLQMRLIRINMSPEEKAKMREKKTHERNRLRQVMSPEEKTKTREKATDGMKRFRQAMSNKETAKKRFRQAMSPE
jgi:hypothetical protein